MDLDLLSLGYVTEEKRKEELFTKYADSYDRVVAQTSYYKKLINNVIRNLRSCKNVVDIGCGTGNITLRLAEAGVNVLAIDNNEAMLAKAEEKIKQKKLNGEVEFLKQDINKLDLGKGVFDGACMINVLYWLEKPYDALGNIYAALQEGGAFVVSGPKPNQNAELLIRDTFREFKHRGIFPALEGDFAVFREVNRILAREAKHFFTTERLQEILTDFVGFSEVIASDFDIGYRTHFGQGYFLSVKKGKDYSYITHDQINIRKANENEIEKTKRIRYHFMKERLGIFEPSAEQEKMMMEFDEFDEYSDYLIAEHQNKILSTARIVRDSKELKLPMDSERSLDFLRKKGEVIFEPGRWIKLPFAPRGIGRKTWYEAYEYSKEYGATYLAALFDENNLEMCRNMGYSMDLMTSSNIKGLKRKAYIEIFPINNPPVFFRRKSLQIEQSAVVF